MDVFIIEIQVKMDYDVLSFQYEYLIIQYSIDFVPGLEV